MVCIILRGKVGKKWKPQLAGYSVAGRHVGEILTVDFIKLSCNRRAYKWDFIIIN